MRASTRKTTTARDATPARARKKTTRSSRRYSPAASKKVERALHEMKRGELVSGRSKKKVKNPKQAIAIGLSEARREGKRVPPPPRARRRKSTPSHAR